MCTTRIKYVKQWIEQNINIHLSIFIQKYGMTVNFLNYVSIIDAMPVSWNLFYSTTMMMIITPHKHIQLIKINTVKYVK